MTETKVSKFIEEKVNTEDLICEVEKAPAIWNCTTEEYSNKTEKQNAWRNVALKFFPDFDDKPAQEKKEIAIMIQKKWKGIRSCYTRELQKKQNEKSGSGATGRKQYVYFEALRFLETISKKTISSIDEETHTVNDQESTDEVEKNLESDTLNYRTERSRSGKSTKRSNKEDDELIHVLKKKIAYEEGNKSDENNEDRMFLLSLVSEMKKVPADRKLKLKAEIISAISKAQESNYHWPQSVPYSGASYHRGPLHHPGQFAYSGSYNYPGPSSYSQSFISPTQLNYSSTSNNPGHNITYVGHQSKNDSSQTQGNSVQSNPSTPSLTENSPVLSETSSDYYNL